jgi:two-component system response regulator NreC
MPPRLRLAPSPAQVKTKTAKTATLVKDAPPISVVLADDHAFMRRTLRLLLDSEQDVEVVAEADDLESVVRSVDGHHPQVLVLDLNLPGDSSIATIGRLRERMPQTQIVVLTMHDDPGFARRTRAAGALGFVLKDLADGELPQAVRAAAHAREYVSPRVAGRLASRQAGSLLAACSRRERDVTLRQPGDVPLSD